jgi:hypothetical protein
MLLLFLFQLQFFFLTYYFFKGAWGEIGVLRQKLVSFLDNSAYYTPEKMLSRFPEDDLYEERAILLSKIKQHEHALFLYVYRLGLNWK